MPSIRSILFKGTSNVLPETICDLGPIRGCVLSTVININRPDGAAYSQTVYVPKYSPRARVVSAIVGS